MRTPAYFAFQLAFRCPGDLFGKTVMDRLGNSMSDHIQAVIFDFGNVLSLPQESLAISRMAELIGLSQENFVESYAKHRGEYDRGTMNDSQYWHLVCDANGVPCTEDLVKELCDTDHRSWSRVNHDIVAWAGAVKAAGHTVAILSNMPVSFYERVLQKYEWIGLFDSLFISGKLQLLKPHAPIYEAALRELGLPADQALFIDDLEPNIEGARHVGLNALHFTGRDSLRPEILRRYGLPALAH